MLQSEYDQLCKDIPNVDLVRPFGIDKDYWIKYWIEKEITVLICQRQTPDLIKLTLSSLLQFYPDIPIIVVDGDSQDDSTIYLRYMAAKHSNIKVWERIGLRHSHGETLDQALRSHIKTKYCLMMDSDVITERGGWIEGMLKQFEDDPKLYATGTRMLVTRDGQACGAPKDRNDVLMYAHISTAIYHVPTYLTLKPAVDHGAAFCHNMTDAERKGFNIGYFPVDKYLSHLSGGSWCVPRTIWKNDFDVYLRPFVTFICTNENQLTELSAQTDHDFNIVTRGAFIDDNFVIHGAEPFHVSNYLYDIRFKVNGEYICLLNESVNNLDADTVRKIKLLAIEMGAPDEMNFGGLELFERKFWQRTKAIQ